MSPGSFAHLVLRWIMITGLAALSLTCKESLPQYVEPTNILSVKVTTIEQLNDRIAPPGRQVVRIVLTGENIHDEVFQDVVNIKGSIRIWWQRKPTRYRTLYLTQAQFTNKSLLHDGKLLLVPGQQFTMEVFWNLKSDDSLYLPSEMNFAEARKRSCDYNIICADPEKFVIESSLNLFDRIGYIAALSREVTFIGRSCVNCGIGPVCPPPPGGCGG